MKKFLAVICIAIFLLASSGGISGVIADDQQDGKRTCTIDHETLPQHKLTSVFGKRVLKHLMGGGFEVYGQSEDRYKYMIIWYDSLSGCSALLSNAKGTQWTIVTHEDAWAVYMRGLVHGDFIHLDDNS